MATGLFHRWGQERAASQTVLREFFNKVASIVNRFRPWNFGGTSIALAKRSHAYSTTPFGAADDILPMAATQVATRAAEADGTVSGWGIAIDASSFDGTLAATSMQFNVKKNGVTQLSKTLTAEQSKVYSFTYDESFNFVAGDELTLEVVASIDTVVPWGINVLVHEQLATM